MPENTLDLDFDEYKKASGLVKGYSTEAAIVTSILMSYEGNSNGIIKRTNFFKNTFNEYLGTVTDRFEDSSYKENPLYKELNSSLLKNYNISAYRPGDFEAIFSKHGVGWGDSMLSDEETNEMLMKTNIEKEPLITNNAEQSTQDTPEVEDDLDSVMDKINPDYKPGVSIPDVDVAEEISKDSQVEAEAETEVDAPKATRSFDDLSPVEQISALVHGKFKVDSEEYKKKFDELKDEESSQLDDLKKGAFHGNGFATTLAILRGSTLRSQSKEIKKEFDAKRQALMGGFPDKALAASLDSVKSYNEDLKKGIEEIKNPETTAERKKDILEKMKGTIGTIIKGDINSLTEKSMDKDTPILTKKEITEQVNQFKLNIDEMEKSDDKELQEMAEKMMKALAEMMSNIKQAFNRATGRGNDGPSGP